MEDYEDVERVLDQIFSDNPDHAENWLNNKMCMKCPYYNKYSRDPL